MDARALAYISAPQLLADWRAILAFANGQPWAEMHRRMHMGAVCHQSGLVKHAKDLGLIVPKRDGELALGPHGKRYSSLANDAPALDILGMVLTAARETEFTMPVSKEHLCTLGGEVLAYSVRLRSHKHGDVGFQGGLSEKHRYLAKHNARSTVLALSAMLLGANAPPLPRDRWAEGTRRVTSSLALRPEELVAGLHSAQLFFGCSMRTIAEWCPLEEAHLLEPFVELDAEAVFQLFGINPVLVGCFLCLASGVSRHTESLATPTSQVWTVIKQHIHDAGAVVGPSRDAVFAPGPRILAQDVSRLRGDPAGR